MILGALIAGGRASRFGSDKALAEWHGKPLIAWAHEAIAPWCVRAVVCGREWGTLTALPDLPAPDLGPLGGIAAALAFAEMHGFASVVTIGCDMPAVPAALVEQLAATCPGYCADAPVLGHWPASKAAGLQLMLTEPGSRAVRGWARAIGALPVPARVPLPNINTLADLPA